MSDSTALIVLVSIEGALLAGAIGFYGFRYATKAKGESFFPSAEGAARAALGQPQPQQQAPPPQPPAYPGYPGYAPVYYSPVAAGAT